MTLMTRLMARIAKLPPAETYDIVVEENIPIPLPDGITLLANHYYPRDLKNRPTILLRSTYTDRIRAGWVSRLFAERGFHLLVVSGRGVAGSGGELTPFRGEHDDGVAVLAWLKQQPWFNGALGTTGASYLGYTQWAIARDAGSILKAMSPQIISSNFRELVYPGHGLALELFLFWTAMVDTQEGSLLEYFRSTVGGGKRRQKASWHLPLGEADRLAVGKHYSFWQDWLEHDQPEDPWWEPADHSQTLSEIPAAAHLVGAWYDFALPYLLRDYTALQKAGRQPYLTIGPWTHFDGETSMTGSREALIWLRAQLLDDRRALRESPVRIFVMGTNEWRDLPAWPPASMQPQRWHLQPNSRLGVELPSESQPDHYRYDPADPTPAVGGPRVMGTGPACQDNCSLEARPDVLTYTGEILNRDMEVIGPISAELFVSSTCEHTDFFVRLCDVHPDGKSMNVCDGLLRLFPGRPAVDAEGCRKLVIDLWPTAYRFSRGHRVRIQVSSGAFPRWNRNLGTGESPATATRMQAADQSVHHDPAHPSAVILPVLYLPAPKSG